MASRVYSPGAPTVIPGFRSDENLSYLSRFQNGIGWFGSCTRRILNSFGRETESEEDRYAAESDSLSKGERVAVKTRVSLENPAAQTSDAPEAQR